MVVTSSGCTLSRVAGPIILWWAKGMWLGSNLYARACVGGEGGVDRQQQQQQEQW